MKYTNKQPTSNGRQPANESIQPKSTINQPNPRSNSQQTKKNNFRQKIDHFYTIFLNKGKRLFLDKIVSTVFPCDLNILQVWK